MSLSIKSASEIRPLELACDTSPLESFLTVAGRLLKFTAGFDGFDPELDDMRSSNDLLRVASSRHESASGRELRLTIHPSDALVRAVARQLLNYGTSGDGWTSRSDDTPKSD